MARHLACCLVALVFVAGTPRAEPQAPAKQGWKELAGTWKPFSREMDGEKELAPKDIVRSLELVIDENGTVVVKENGKVFDAKIVVKLNPDQSPARVDFIVAIPPSKVSEKKTCPGIYKLEGDTLTICYREPGAGVDRPTEFATKKGDRRVLLVLKRKQG